MNKIIPVFFALLLVITISSPPPAQGMESINNVINNAVANDANILTIWNDSDNVANFIYNLIQTVVNAIDELVTAEENYDELEDAEDLAQQQIVLLQNQITTLQTQNANLQQQVINLQQENANLKPVDNRDSGYSCDDDTNMNSDSRRSLSEEDADGYYTLLLQCIAENDSEIDSLNAEIETLETEISYLQSEMAETLSEINSIKLTLLVVEYITNEIYPSVEDNELSQKLEATSLITTIVIDLYIDRDSVDFNIADLI